MSSSPLPSPSSPSLAACHQPARDCVWIAEGAERCGAQATMTMNQDDYTMFQRRLQYANRQIQAQVNGVPGDRYRSLFNYGIDCGTKNARIHSQITTQNVFGMLGY